MPIHYLEFMVMRVPLKLWLLEQSISHVFIYIDGVTKEFPEVKDLDDSSGEETWNDSSEVYIERITDVDTCESEQQPSPPIEDIPDISISSSQSALVMWFIRFLLIFQAVNYITDSAINALLKFFCIFLKALGPFSEFAAGITSEFPCSLYQLKKKFP